jgi:recombination protein RecA
VAKKKEEVLDTEEQEVVVDKKKETKNRIEKMRALLNKKAGQTVAWNLNDPTSPNNVKMWIPTGSRWLDSIIAKPDISGTKRAGIPMGKIVEIAGLESAGKSYMALQIAKNAQEMGIDVVYFDSESALDASFCTRIGVDLDKLVYVHGTYVEELFETMEQLLGAAEGPMLFIWDSYAMTPCKAEVEGGFNPNQNIAVKARVSSLAMSKILTPLANQGSTLLVINQLKTNIDPSNPSAMLSTPYVTPGGKALNFAYSLRIWLTRRKAKKWFIENEHGDRIGSDVKASLEKNRFGCERRECHFKILWGDNKNVSIQDELSWFEAIKPSRHLTSGGPWHTLDMGEGKEPVKFQSEAGFMKCIENPEFKQRVLEVMDEVLIQRKL